MNRLFVTMINNRYFSGLGYGSGSDDEGQNSGDNEDSDDESEDEYTVRERIKRKRAAFERKMREMEEEGKWYQCP